MGSREKTNSDLLNGDGRIKTAIKTAAGQVAVFDPAKGEEVRHG